VEAQAHAALASVMASRGEWNVATGQAKSARAVADVIGTIEAIFTAHIAESTIARARGDGAGVIASLGPLVSNGQSRSMTMLTSLGWWPVLINAYIDQGDVETAQEHLDRLSIAANDRAIDVAARAGALRARISLAKGDLDGATKEFALAIDQLGPDEAMLDRATIHHCFGRLLLARGKRQLAIAQLRSAYELYDGAGALPFRRRVEADLSQSGLGETARSDRSALSLTDREQDVVSLVVKGMTNREVAAELYISTKAVEYHLRNVFGKLGVSSRSELRELVAK